MTANPKLFALLAVLTAAPAFADEGSVSLQTIVPRVCYVSPNGGIESGAGFVQVTAVTEFCNSAGYSVMLDYTPGTLRGAVASFAGNSVVLDGSGQATLLEADYAVSRVSTLMIAQTGIEHAEAHIQLRMTPR